MAYFAQDESLFIRSRSSPRCSRTEPAPFLPLTAEDLPYLTDDDRRCELVAGELIREPPPGADHGGIAATLIGRLFAFVHGRNVGRVFAETGFVLAHHPDTVRAPDAAFVSAQRIRDATRRGPYVVGAPDLAVEILSPSNTHEETIEKVHEYLAAGGGAVWVIDPRRQRVTVHRPGHEPRRLARDETLDGAPVLGPGLGLGPEQGRPGSPAGPVDCEPQHGGPDGQAVLDLPLPGRVRSSPWVPELIPEPLSHFGPAHGRPPMRQEGLEPQARDPVGGEIHLLREEAERGGSACAQPAGLPVDLQHTQETLAPQPVHPSEQQADGEDEDQALEDAAGSRPEGDRQDDGCDHQHDPERRTTEQQSEQRPPRLRGQGCELPGRGRRPVSGEWPAANPLVTLPELGPKRAGMRNETRRLAETCGSPGYSPEPSSSPSA